LASPVPVVVYVAPIGATATSAGCFITLAASVAAMAPATTIGAAHPVTIGGAFLGDNRRRIPTNGCHANGTYRGRMQWIEVYDVEFNIA
jgi:membrane-bound ClpP family serine protease